MNTLRHFLPSGTFMGAMSRWLRQCSLRELSICVVLLGALMGGCGFTARAYSHCGEPDSPDYITCTINASAIVPVGSDTRKIVYEAPGLIRVVHGTSCVSRPSAWISGDDNLLGFRVQQQESVPLTIADSGTVFLNGWDLRYHNDDHHLQGFGAAIANITEARDPNSGQFVLNWDAGGVLSDENGDDPYDMCYSYTVVFWNRSSIAFDAVALARSLPFRHPSGSDPGNDTALRELPGFSDNAYGQGVVLPQGFAQLWTTDGDHHLLQSGFDLGTPTVVNNDLSWTSRTLLKDNDQRRDYMGAELVTVLSYESPKMLHPQTVMVESPNGWVPATNEVPLAPQDSSWFCTGIGNPTGEAHYRIDNVPLEYAVPVLRGWELGYLCSDNHVRHMGASITDFHFERADNATSGTLFYTLSLPLSDDSGNLDYARAVVDVFGMNALGAGPHPIDVPGTNHPFTPLPCTFGSTTIADGDSVRAYLESSPPVCEPCQSEARVCSNGTLSGSFTSESCTVRRPGRGQVCP
ncbi:MAG: hypothetical protein FIA96_17060 [Betaproteobacteria bacterium]|nr:hypothetical protein [Betaproteobacteria bacterium]